MFVKCNDCGKVYDDAVRWTICPHAPLEASADGAGYCKEHDLFNCFICARERAEDLL